MVTCNSRCFVRSLCIHFSLAIPSMLVPFQDHYVRSSQNVHKVHSKFVSFFSPLENTSLRKLIELPYHAESAGQTICHNNDQKTFVRTLLSNYNLTL
jgi:hypothetical protein